MSADGLIARLDGVRKTGPGRWLARCPAHSDKSPSLSVKDADNGLVLAHCFAGCNIDEVLGAVGLTVNDLFPDRLPVNHGSQRRPFLPTDVFDIARREIGVVAVVAADLHKNKVVSDADYERIFVAVERLNDIAGAAYGR